IDDVLVLFRRVLREFQRAVWTPVEPFGMLLDPGVIGRTLEGEIERDLETVILRGFHKASEILERAELGMNGIVAASLRADGIDRAGVAALRLQRIVAALAVGLADGMYRREIENVKAHRLDVRQLPDDIVERAVARGVVRHRAREEF